MTFLQRASSAALLAVTLAAFGQAASPQRLVAVGDIHGDLPAFTSVLRAASLIDGEGRWSGGTARLVQTGDFTDRGPDVRAVMDLLQSLETAAPRTGGAVHVLLGNHEVMNLLGDYRDVNPRVFAAFADSGSEPRRERAYADHRRLGDRRARALGVRPRVYDVADRNAWMAARPPGFIEHAEALSPSGSYGRWLRQKPAALEAAGTIFMHAGIDPDSAPSSIHALNDTVREEIRRFDAARAYFIRRAVILPFFTLSEVIAAVTAEAEALLAGRVVAPDRRHLEMVDGILRLSQSPLLAPNGPLWFRGFATWPDEEAVARLPSLLEKYGASRFVTGHTVQRAITPRAGGRIVLIDTGMLQSVYKGRPGALEIVGNSLTAVYADERVPLQDSTGHRPPDR